MAAAKTTENRSPDKGYIKAFDKFFRNLPEKPETTIRFFNRGDYYTVHGQDAIFTAKEWDKTTSFVKNYSSGDDALETLNLNKGKFEAYIRHLLLVKHYRVEVYTGGSKTNNWTLEYKGSPGNLAQFEDLLFENAEQVEGSTVIALKVGYESKAKQKGTKLTGVALLDSLEQKMCVCEIADDEYFSNTEALIVQLAAKECILVSESNRDNDLLKKIVQRSGILVSMRKKSEFCSQNLDQDLNRLIRFDEGQQQNVMTFSQMDLSIATDALASIIKYLELTSNEENFHQFKFETIENNKFLHLDSAAMSALSIIPSANVTAFNKHHSVYGLLDRCRTPHGHRLLMQWVRQPLRDVNVINERLDIVEALVTDTEVLNELRDDHFRRIPDLQVLANKLQRSKATIQDCFKVYKGIQKLPVMIKLLESCNDGATNASLKSVFINVLREEIQDMSKFEEMIESTLDMSAVDKGEFLIKAEFDGELQEMREKMEHLESKMKKELSKVANVLGLQEKKTIKLESNAQFGYFLRVNLKDGKMVQNRKEFDLLDTHKAGVRFRSRKLSELNDEYNEIYRQYTLHQKTIVDELIKIAGGYSNTLQYLSTTLGKLDVLASFATVAVEAASPYVRPLLKPQGSGILKLDQVRHPCVEIQDGVSYIPNSVQFEQGSCTLEIITGPNMGGKSTYIRSVGVVALLAHMGSFVPCDFAQIPILDSVLARVGANDSLVKGMSTFMLEMVETSSIIRRATCNSLVIIDELGRGTSTYEGCGIACAIVEHLARDLKSFTLFATHFHELTLLSQEISVIRNVHVSAIVADSKLTHLYQVKSGPCDQSFGIHVAKMAKFPPHVIQEAERKLEQLDDLSTFDGRGIDEAERYRIIKEGKAIINEVLSSCAAIKDKKLPEDELREEFKKIKDSVIKRNNAYVMAVISN